MSIDTVFVLGRPYECKCCGRKGFDSADLPSHSATCRSKVAILIAIPNKYVVTEKGKKFNQFHLEFEYRFAYFLWIKLIIILLFIYLYVCLFALRPKFESYYSSAFGIDLNEYSIFLAPEFFVCGNCGCLKNRGEICHHLEECFTGFKDDNLRSPTFRIKEKHITDSASYILALLEFVINVYFIIIFYFNLLVHLLLTELIITVTTTTTIMI